VLTTPGRVDPLTTSQVLDLMWISFGTRLAWVSAP